jgi:hypothetical protein
VGLRCPKRPRGRLHCLPRYRLHPRGILPGVVTEMQSRGHCHRRESCTSSASTVAWRSATRTCRCTCPLLQGRTDRRHHHGEQDCASTSSRSPRSRAPEAVPEVQSLDGSLLLPKRNKLIFPLKKDK